MNIVFLNGNGGAGQTTLSVLFALALHDAGHRPVVRKLDPRVTASRFLVSP
jgi:cellulose biosynthesis protein BcsQ